MFVEFLNAKGNQYGGATFWYDEDNEHAQLIIEDNRWNSINGYGDFPVTNVSWYGASEYCKWKGYRLPTEAEWEKAAKGGRVNRDFPWGNVSPSCEVNSDNGAQFDMCGGNSARVMSFSPNGYGLFDISGNVWEWVSDWYDEDYYSHFSLYRPPGTNVWGWAGYSWRLMGR